MQTATQIKAISSTTHSGLAKARQPVNVAPTMNGLEAPAISKQPEESAHLGYSFGSFSIFPPEPPIQMHTPNAAVPPLQGMVSRQADVVNTPAVQPLVVQSRTSSPTIQRDEKTVTKPKPKTELEKEQTQLEQYAGYVRQLIRLGVIEEIDYKKFDERLHGEETEVGLQTFIEEREAIKKEKQNPKERAKHLQDAERALRAALNQDIAPKVNAKIEQLSQDTQLRINQSFSSIADLLQKRIYFLIVMPKYFMGKSVDEVIDHFKAVNQVNIPGMPAGFALHNTVTERLKRVAARMQELGMPMPETDVGFGLRDRFDPDDLSSWGLMVHAMGIAIDYRATTNQHFKDPLKISLRDVLIGGPGRFQLPDSKLKKDPNSYASGYQLVIKKMGAQMAANGQLDEETGQEAAIFFTQFDAEFARLSGASHGMVEKAKKSGMTAQLQEGRTLLDRKAELHKEITAQQKKAESLDKYEGKTVDDKTSKSDKAKIEQLQQTQQKMQQHSIELLDVNLKIAQIKANLPTLFADWITQIDAQSGAIEKKLPDFAKLPAMKNIMEGEQNIAKYQEDRAKLAQVINDLRLPKMPTLKIGKLSPKESGNETKRVRGYMQHFQKQIERQQYLSAVQRLTPVLASEEQALEKAKLAKDSPDQETADLTLSVARKLRQEMASLAVSKAEKQTLTKTQLSKNQLQSFQHKYATILDKESFDSALLQQVQTQFASAQQLQDVIEKERQEYTRAIGGYKAADAGQFSAKPEAKAAFAAKEEYVKFKRLKEIRNRLLNDETFIFGSSSKLEVADPSVWQMVKVGFFSPDQEPTGRSSMSKEKWLEYMKQPNAEQTGQKKEARQPDRHEGFNQNFMRLMALYGFDQGVSWHSAQDSMHFELIEMKEKIAKP